METKLQAAPPAGKPKKERKSVSLARGALSLTTAKFITIAIGTGSSMLMARFRTLTEYGTYSSLLLAVNTVSTLLMLGLPHSINYFLARASTKEQKQHFLSTYYTFSTLLSLIIGACLVAATPMIAAYFDNPDIKNYVYFFAICPWIYITSGCVDNLLIAYQHTRALMAFRISNSILLFGIIFVVQLANWTFSVYMLLYVVVEACYALCAYFFARSYSGGLRFRLDFKLIRRILTFSVPLGLSGSVAVFNTEIDKLFIGRVLTPEALAIYNYGSRQLPFWVIPIAITSVLTPLIVRMVKRNQVTPSIKLWNRVVEFSFGILCFAAVILFVFAPQVVRLLYSEKYMESVPVFRVFCFMLIMQTTYFGMLLNATGRTKFIFYSSLLSLAANIGLNVVFYFVLGLGTVGFAIASVASIGVISVVQIIVTSKVIHYPFRKIFPWRRLLRILIMSFSIGGFGYFALQLSILGAGRINPEFVAYDHFLAIFWGLVCCGIYLFVYRKYIKMLLKYINSFKMADASKEDAAQPPAALQDMDAEERVSGET